MPNRTEHAFIFTIYLRFYPTIYKIEPLRVLGGPPKQNFTKNDMLRDYAHTAQQRNLMLIRDEVYTLSELFIIFITLKLLAVLPVVLIRAMNE
jgi:hypothetical protein